MKRKILHIEILLLSIFLFISTTVIFGKDAYLTTVPDTVKVTNIFDVVNGNTLNIDSLNSNPGLDGISFREALYATNNTPGKKTITFHPSLSGTTIILDADGEQLRLSSGELTIDGDINKDGNPDITLDGHLFKMGSLSIVSSENTITGLNFSDFIGHAIGFSCPDAGCGTKFFTNNKIINNVISSHTGYGIGIGTLGLVLAEDAPMLSNISWQGILIKGNVIDTKKSAMDICPAVGGGDQNQMFNVTISDNHISSEAEVTLDIIVADVNSAYFGIPGSIDYSDYNLIDSLTITNNVIEAPNGFGIHIICANAGNSQNKLKNVKISGNTINNTKNSCISLQSGGAADSNIITNVEITQNTISQSSGIYLEGGYQSWGVRANNNRLENVLIAENEIFDYTEVGIYLCGGSSQSGIVSGNILDMITISENNIYQTVKQYNDAGIFVQGGAEFTSNGSPVQNIAKGLHILNNQISNSFRGIQLMGGTGIGAKNNQVIIEKMQGNTLVGNNISLDIMDNNDGATNNKVIILNETSIEEAIKITPKKHQLYHNFPNPFNPSTTIKYTIQKSSHVILKIYNLSGQEIETVVNDYQTIGTHEIIWQPKGLPNGIYFYRLQAGEVSETKKLILQM